MKINHLGNLHRALAELKNNQNNAVAHVYENHGTPSSGDLKNLIVTIKDVYATSNAYTTASSKFLKHFAPHYDAAVVKRLNDQGATIVAKTHGDELALGGTGQYSAFGLITNPLDHTRLVGGSSSGAAATFTDAIGLALGSDTGDSVRLPASYVGINGFKPSYGAISRHGLFPFATSLDTVGYFSHDLHDMIVFSQILYGQDSQDASSIEVAKPILEKHQPSSIAILDEFEVLSSDVQIALRNLIKRLQAANIKVNFVKIDQDLLASIEIVYMVIAFAEASSNMAALQGISFGNRALNQPSWMDLVIKSRSQWFGKMVQMRLALGSFFLEEKNYQPVFQKAQAVRAKISEAFAKIYENNDCLIFPSATIAPLISEGKAKNWYSAYLSHANLCGSPSLSMKWIKEATSKMPVNLNIDGKLYDDGRLLSIAWWLEDFLRGQNG